MSRRLPIWRPGVLPAGRETLDRRSWPGLHHQRPSTFQCHYTWNDVPTR